MGGRPAWVSLPVSLGWKIGAFDCCAAQGTQVFRSRLCLTERVTPNGASSAPFALESHRYASQTRSVRRNPHPYDMG